MGNLGTGEILLVLLAALLVLGPSRLPSAARQAGKALAEFRRMTSGLQTEMRDAMSDFQREVSVHEAPPTFPAAIDQPAEPPPVETAATETAWVFPDMTPPTDPDKDS